MKDNNKPDWWERDQVAENKRDMEEIKKIQNEICTLRVQCEELQDRAGHIWRETDNKRVESVADEIQTQLEYVASLLSELEELKTDAAEYDDNELDDWFYDLDTSDKERITGIAYIIENDRGDSYYDWKDRVTKWWSARTTEQKREIFRAENEL